MEGFTVAVEGSQGTERVHPPSDKIIERIG